jgi:hypothetical protein
MTVLFINSYSLAPADPSGGTVTESGGYRYHTFTASDTLSVPASKSVEYLIVAGGGWRSGWWWC